MVSDNEQYQITNSKTLNHTIWINEGIKIILKPRKFYFTSNTHVYMYISCTYSNPI